MFEIIGMIVSAICFLVGFVMIALFIATKSEYFSVMILNRASKKFITQASERTFNSFINRVKLQRKKYFEKEELNK
ncbi:MAG TPA: hypothetical protein K8U92_06980 [Aliarcobacter thereius]|nr:hypothetical protein [Aliarcobacter thereius]HJE03607.1 hypothetical protein [Aliarcobacter thereius]